MKTERELFEEWAKERGLTRTRCEDTGVYFNQKTLYAWEAWLERDPTQKLSTATDWNKDYGLVMWYERNFYPSEEMIVNDLYEKGLLEAGEYEIDVDW